MKNLQNKLKSFIRKFKKVIVAFSGGTDSSLVLKLSVDSLGRKNVIAVTSISETFPKIDRYFARIISKKLKVKHIFIKTQEFQNEQFVKNPVDRCYYCKKELFTKIKKIAKKFNIKTIFDGSNYDDLKDFRPGRIAVKELKIISPLIENKIGKKEIRKLSRVLGLPTWNKPQMPCLASRIPYGCPLDKNVLKKIDSAENYIRKMGFKDVRVRHLGDTARIEVSKEKIPLVLNKKVREKIVRKLKALGYKYITVDLEGYRTGSLNP
ncbi:MAG: ATP-dependent sacrificial sulfur transferase LarE [Endomicrobiia bacterium]